VNAHKLAAPYVGVPYVDRGRDADGLDCWGICLLFAREQLRLALPEYFYPPEEMLARAPGLIAGAIVPGGRWRAVEVIKPGDVVLFRIAGVVCHCGIALGSNLFLHTLPGRNSTVESLADVEWNQRMQGAYRWTHEF
jgi:probable lipoprotein NlpC